MHSFPCRTRTLFLSWRGVTNLRALFYLGWSFCLNKRVHLFTFIMLPCIGTLKKRKAPTLEDAVKVAKTDPVKRQLSPFLSICAISFSDNFLFLFIQLYKKLKILCIQSRIVNAWGYKVLLMSNFSIYFGWLLSWKNLIHLEHCLDLSKLTCIVFFILCTFK